MGSIYSFAPGQPKAAPFYLVKKEGWVETREPKVVWVVRKGETEFACFNARCTHLGCIVDWTDQGMAGLDPDSDIEEEGMTRGKPDQPTRVLHPGPAPRFAP